MKISRSWRGVSGIYRIANTVNGKLYVGSSRDLHSRLMGHRAGLRGGRHHNQMLQRAWDKYGEVAMEVDILEECGEVSLPEREQYWLDHFDPFGDRGYNIHRVAYSSLGQVHSEETRHRIARASTGRKHRPISLDLMREVQGNRDDAWKENISRGKKGWKPVAAIAASADLRRGVPLTAEHRGKIQAGLLASPEEVRRAGRAACAEKLRGCGRPPEVFEKARATFLSRPESIVSKSEKLRIAATGKKLSPETIARRTATRARNDALRKRGEM